MKFVEQSPFADLDVAARKPVEIANEIGPRSQCKKRLDIVTLSQQLCCSFDGTTIVAWHVGSSL
jgi:hypothetical protein